ncbi:uncharacterized protein [Pyrus communis]|uniref:uncharacterized protein n=1 Tax=Pyrus communis TaxID=23211 RepID=UPI0035C0A3E6
MLMRTLAIPTRATRVVVKSRIELESLIELWNQKKDQWFKRNRKWEPRVLTSIYPKDRSDARQLQHLAAREGINGVEIVELGEVSRKHGERVQSWGDVKGAFKILAKLNKQREKLEVVRISMSQFVQQLEAGASVRIGTEKQAMTVGRLREFVSTSSLCALVLEDADVEVSGMVADVAREAGFTRVNLGIILPANSNPEMSSVMVSMANFLAMEDRCEKLKSKISHSRECFVEKANKVHRAARVVVKSRIELESLIELWNQKNDQWFKRNRKWEPRILINRYPKDRSDARQLQHLASCCSRRDQ